MNTIDKIHQRIAEQRKRHKQDVKIVRRDYPEMAEFLTEMAEFLTEMTKEFGKCEYRVVLR